MHTYLPLIKTIFFFDTMAELYSDLNHQERRTIKRHILGYITRDTSSGSGGDHLD